MDKLLRLFGASRHSRTHLKPEKLFFSQAAVGPLLQTQIALIFEPLPLQNRLSHLEAELKHLSRFSGADSHTRSRQARLPNKSETRASHYHIFGYREGVEL